MTGAAIEGLHMASWQPHSYSTFCQRYSCALLSIRTILHMSHQQSTICRFVFQKNNKTTKSPFTIYLISTWRFDQMQISLFKLSIWLISLKVPLYRAALHAYFFLLKKVYIFIHETFTTGQSMHKPM